MTGMTITLTVGFAFFVATVAAMVGLLWFRNMKKKREGVLIDVNALSRLKIKVRTKQLDLLFI